MSGQEKEGTSAISHDMNPSRYDLQQIAEKMKSYQPGILGDQLSRTYSVMIPLIQTEDNKLAVLFEERAHTLRSQAGEICFPGGRWESGDDSFWDTAKRETSEELQIPLESIEYMGSLDTVFSHAQITIHAYVGRLTDPMAINPNPAEVERVFSIDLEDLLTMKPARYEVSMKPMLPEDYPLHLIPDGENYKWREAKIPHYFYQFGEITIWGLTAKILHHFLEIIQK
ncbi:NUDIX hydrolase [Brevibacillus ginsengisoli]|uniref:NUDIX hydrolase n=1 Tax=Brevibacillus ginsengisoli TaxID=363854 RepID=UPI003CF7E678